MTDDFIPLAQARQQTTGRRSQLRRLNLGNLQGQPVPERQWIVPGWIPARTVTMLGGDGGTGKSLLAMQLLTASAIGGTWLGMPVERRRALGIFCEDSPDELHRRQAAINEHVGIDFADIAEGLDLVSREGEDNALLVFNTVDRTSDSSGFWIEIVNLIHDSGAQLMVLDSLHDLFAGNENSRPEARRFIQLLSECCRDADATIVLTAHPSLSGLSSGSGYSGSTAWSNAVRSRLYLTRPKSDDDGPEDRDRRELRRLKANYAGIGDVIGMTWRDGVLIADDAPTTGILASIDRDNVDAIFLDCLDAATRQSRALSDSKNAQNFAPKIMAKMPQARGATRQALAAAMERMFSAGEIVNGSPFTKPNRHVAIGIVRAPKEGPKDV